MTKEQELSGYVRNFWRGRDPETEALVRIRADQISPKAAELFAKYPLIDASAYHLNTVNWQVECSGAAAVCFHILEASDTSPQGALQQIAEYIDVIRKNEDFFVQILKAEDIEKAKKDGRFGVILSGQTCSFISDKLIAPYVELFARMGLRTMNLAYNKRTFAADGGRCGTDAGLTPDGKKLIAAMNRYGITIDLSHVGKRSALEACKVTQSPLIYSHSNPEKLFPGPRSISEEEARACAATGGVVCVSGYAPTLWNGTDEVTIERFTEAVLYYAEVIGPDHVGIGIDSMVEPGTFSPADTEMMCRRIESHHEDAAAYWQNYEAGYGRESVSTIGLYGIANHRNIVDSLLKHGMAPTDIVKVMGANLLRVFKESWR